MNLKIWFIVSLLITSITYATDLPFEIRHIPTTKPWVAITFDDGPSIYTERILQQLAKKNATATFFLQAKNIEQYPNLALKIYAAGHSVANHGYQHDHVEKKNPKQLIEMIAKSQLVFYDIFDFIPRYYRPAYSRIAPGQIDLLKMHFLHLIRWNIDPQDWNKKHSKRYIINHITKNIKAGDIIILHESEKTIKLLPKLIKKIQKKGLQCKDIDSIMASI
mgnify:CR=1 FL=1